MVATAKCLCHRFVRKWKNMIRGQIASRNDGGPAEGKGCSPAMFQRLFLTAIFFVCCATLGRSATDVAGVVVSHDGKPLPKAKVYGGGLPSPTSEPEQTLTDGSGFFRLTNHWKVIFVRLKGYRMASRAVPDAGGDIRIVLDPVQDTDWNVPLCASGGPSHREVGFPFKFTLPKHAKLKRSRDVDYVIYLVHFGKAPGWLNIMSGPLVGGTFDEGWVVESSSYTQRAIMSEPDIGVGNDWRGTLKDGTHWRWTKIVGGLVRYKTPSPEAAAYFDSIVDSACEARF